VTTASNIIMFTPFLQNNTLHVKTKLRTPARVHM